MAVFKILALFPLTLSISELKFVNLFQLKLKTVIATGKFFTKTLGLKLPVSTSASALILNGNKVLVIDLSYKNGYALPGGGIQYLENLEEGLKREITEETGLKTISLKYYKSYGMNIEYPTVNVVFISKAMGSLKSSPEGQPLWVSPKDALQKMVYEDNKQALKDFLSM